MNETQIHILWKDPEIIGRIFAQVGHLNHNNIILRGALREFYEILFNIMHKLEATKYHLSNYAIAEARLREKAIEEFKKNPIKTFEAFDLIFELEGFLGQIKSSLDILVKLFIPVLGKHFLKTKTYRNKGEDLIKGLENYKNSSKAQGREKIIDDFIRLITNEKKDWIKVYVEIRDQLNHYKSIQNYYFTLSIINGQVSAIAPMFSGRNTLEFMRLIFSNNIQYHQDFIMFLFWLIAPNGLTIVNENPGNLPRIVINGEDVSKYIKWGWGIS